MLNASPFAFGPITNKKASDTRRVLAGCIRNPRLQRAFLASAYLTKAGWAVLKKTLETAVMMRGKRVHLLTGVKDDFTDPEALEAALRLAKRSNGRLEVRVSRNPRFHAKAYLFDYGSTTTLLVGSANMTSDGMRVDGELSLQIDGQSHATSMDRARRWFETVFDRTNSRIVDRTLVDAYRRARPRPRPRGPMDDRHRGLFQILGKVTPERGDSPNSAHKNHTSAGHPAIWHACIDGNLSDDAKAELTANTDWYDRAPELICFPTPPRGFHKAKSGDKVLVFDYSRGKRSGRLAPATLLETHDFPVTEDGRHFLVLRYKKKGWRRLKPGYTTSLVERGFARNKKTLYRHLRRVPKTALAVVREDFGKLI